MRHLLLFMMTLLVLWHQEWRGLWNTLGILDVTLLETTYESLEIHWDWKVILIFLTYLKQGTLYESATKYFGNL